MISYGKFIQTVIDFTIIAFVIFIVIKAINSQKRKEELLLSNIRDILKEKQ
jgi:large conductance mechanosensitive channel